VGSLNWDTNGLGRLGCWDIWAFLGTDEHRSKGWNVEIRVVGLSFMYSVQDF